MSAVLDHIAAARARYAHEGTRGIEWYWDRSMTQADRDAFDRYLVVTCDPLAYQPGTQESRFRAYVRREVSS